MGWVNTKLSTRSCLYIYFATKAIVVVYETLDRMLLSRRGQRGLYKNPQHWAFLCIRREPGTLRWRRNLEFPTTDNFISSLAERGFRIKPRKNRREFRNVNAI